MHNYKKLTVAGCSVSDRGSGVDWCYGDKLAELLDVEYDHQGAICGSNDRIFRVVTNGIINGSIDTDTLVVIQYTQPVRREFWTSNTVDEPFPGPVNPTGRIPLVESYGEERIDGQLVRWKPNAHSWQKVDSIGKFFKQYEEQFADLKYAADVFAGQHYNFVHMLNAKKIPHVFLNAWSYSPRRDLYWPSESKVLHISERNLDNKRYRNVLPNGELDWHFNNAGHIEVAQRIYNLL